MKRRNCLGRSNGLPKTEVMRNGLIMTPAHDRGADVRTARGRATVTVIAIAPAGENRSSGFDAVRDFICGELSEATQ